MKNTGLENHSYFRAAADWNLDGLHFSESKLWTYSLDFIRKLLQVCQEDILQVPALLTLFNCKDHKELKVLVPQTSFPHKV